mmetsp:Transcript_9334/g.27712  ORF Transcript_9334/g.27712 Transcript_9334/m.27712 type:complete len:213 (-) Transcript_9334:206-844(-)
MRRRPRARPAPQALRRAAPWIQARTAPSGPACSRGCRATSATRVSVALGPAAARAAWYRQQPPCRVQVPCPASSRRPHRPRARHRNPAHATSGESATKADQERRPSSAGGHVRTPSRSDCRTVLGQTPPGTGEDASDAAKYDAHSAASASNHSMMSTSKHLESHIQAAAEIARQRGERKGSAERELARTAGAGPDGSGSAGHRGTRSAASSS